MRSNDGSGGNCGDRSQEKNGGEKSQEKNSQPNKRTKGKGVSFAQEVISKDNSNGSKVLIKEEHGIFLGPLLGRIAISDSSSDHEDSSCATGAISDSESSAGNVISFANDMHTNEKISYSESSDGIIKSTTNTIHNNIEYDNLVVRLGLLKCGHRYQVVVTIPNYWKQQSKSDADTNKTIDNDTNIVQTHGMTVRIAEESMDGDLIGEIIQHGMSGTTSDHCQYQICVTLSARRRGPYRGRIVLELTRVEENEKANETTSDTADNILSKQDGESKVSDSTSQTPNKCLMSLQFDATVMGKDMGTPKLRNGVICKGKIVGYDSDDETEWQGFDS